MHPVRREPIAIVGIGCRFPGAENPQAFWQLLREGRSAIREIPDDRWQLDESTFSDLARPGGSVSRWGGFLDSVDQFDWHAFRMLPREIKYMDPQHRLLLEVAWEALEDAGLPLQSVAGTRTGVFMGLIWHDYLRLQARNWSHLDGYTPTGNASSFASSRLSYFFGLRGPSLSLDAGCTSSLASVQLACQSLWSGETEMALAGGVNLMLSPDTMIFISKTGMLSPDGCCRVLDVQADGFVRGEGAGIVVLKPLSAVQHGDRVYALIRGVVSNHNGHNEWMIAPSEAAQQELLQEAYQQAGVDRSSVDYVELHGTGFQRGDSVEINALGAVLGTSPQRTNPCLVGSVKTNIGHLEAAAGIASLIKVALSLYQREIPPTLHLKTLNPEIPFAELNIAPQQELGPWSDHDAPLFAGVSTIALTGVNAHAVLESFPHSADADQDADKQVRVLPLSARSREALRAQMVAMRDFLSSPPQSRAMSWQNVCYTASVRRTHHEFRCAVIADSLVQAANALDQLLESEATDEQTSAGTSQFRPHRPVFLLGHRGVQWARVNTRSLMQEPAASSIINTCNLTFSKLTGQPLFVHNEGDDLCTLTIPTNHPVTSFVLQIALASLWCSWGIVPEALVGEGSGEVAAAYIAGAISLEDAMQVLLSGPSSLKSLEAEKQGDRHARTTAIPCYSATQGLLGGGQELVTCHWEQQLKDPQLDIDALDQFLHHDYDVFIALGPPSALPGAVLLRLQDHERQGVVLESLGMGEKPVIWETLSSLYTMGFAINWSKLYTGTEKCVSLPTYRWQRERFWLDGMDVAAISTPPEAQAQQLQHLNSQQAVATANALIEEALTSLNANDSIEKALVSIWSEVLGVENVQPHDSFFELGGHSLLAGELLARIQSILQVKITLADLFHSPTPASCTSLVLVRKITADEHTRLAELPSLIARPAERYQPFPTTDIQQAYWMGRRAIFELGNVGNHGYIEAEALDFHLERLQPTLQRLIERHEMLRTVLLPDGQQCILEQVPPFEVEIEDLQALSAAQQEQRLLEIRQEMDHELLPLEHWPAFRVHVSRLSAQRVRLHLSIESLFLDAWSMHLLIQEFVRLYWEPETELPPFEVSFRDYVLSAQSMQEHESFHRAQAYWTQRLASLPPAPELPLARPPASVQQPHFVHYEGRLPAADWQMLKARGARAGLTPSGILLTAFSEVLACWSKTPHFSINLTLFHRLPLHAQIHALAGDFTSLTLLEVDCRDACAFEQRARRLQEQLWLDLDHRDYSGVRVLRDLARAQGETARALMPVVFTSLLVQDTSSSYQSPWQKIVYCVSQTPQVWLDHQVLEQNGDLVFHWQVIEDLFPAGLIPDLFDAYSQLLLGLVHSEQQWLEPMHDLLPARQLAIRQQRNATFSPRPDSLLLHTPALQQIALRPDDLAIITPSRRLTYRELYNGAARLAQDLHQAGARPNHLVAVVMEKGWEQVVGVMAILLAGAAYVPIDPSLPLERLHSLLAQSAVDLILTQSWLDCSLSWPPDLRRFCVDDVDLNGPAPILPPLSQSPEDLAYVIYTSGSTGVPKGVMIEHRSAINTIVDLNQRFSISPQDRVLALSALNFDLSVYDIFGILGAGGAIVLPEGEQGARDPRVWLHLLRTEQVTLWNTVPALLQMLVEYVESHPSALSDLQSDSRLRLAYLSGDWIPLTLPERVRALLPHLQVISMGGATEASIWSIIYPITTVEAGWASIPYGWPMENQRWDILNDHLEAAPDWVVGHLYIAGAGLARGYWRDEEKTASKFIQHPRTGERLYHTGDLGRYWPDGTIEFLGREDFQVKIQGYRIELGEIEFTLRQHSGVQEAVAIATGASHDTKRLLAYITPKVGSSLSVESVRSFLKERLPAYMIPSSLVLLDTFPLTSNGKVDRKALLALPQQNTSASDTSISSTGEQPTTPSPKALPADNSMLARVADLVKKVLKIEHIDPSVNLLECGATSLDVFRISNALDQELQIQIEFSQLFRLSTLEAIAAYCQQQRPADSLFTGVLEQRSEHKPGVHSDHSKLLLDPEERERFKDAQPGLRQFTDTHEQVQLLVPEQEAQLLQRYAERRSYRKFVKQTITFKQFSELLGCLRQLSLNGKPKYQWGSAGSLYPVQAYLYIKPNAIEQMESGIYYYHPIAHQLILITPNVQIERSIFGSVNLNIFEQSAFGIFLIGQLTAIAPMYAELSKDFCLIEAGLMTQLLEMSAPALQLALCQIGGIGFEEIRNLFALDDSAIYLHCLLGGAMEVEMAELLPPTNTDDWDEGAIE